jgi:hypothetical protein
VICVSSYVEDLARLDDVVRELKQRGHRRVSRSSVLRVALEQFDLDRFATAPAPVEEPSPVLDDNATPEACAHCGRTDTKLQRDGADDWSCAKGEGCALSLCQSIRCERRATETGWCDHHERGRKISRTRMERAALERALGTGEDCAHARGDAGRRGEDPGAPSNAATAEGSC